MDDFEEIRVLVVDGDEAVRNLMVKILEKAGYQVLTSSRGKQAMEIVANDGVDVVLADVKIADGNGYDLLREMKAKWPQVAVIMMTAFADSYTIKDALLAGADEYVTKPFKSYEVTTVIERAYWRMRAQRNQSSGAQP